jgi:hypothetical protein
MKTKNQTQIRTSSLRSLVAAGLMAFSGLAGLVGNAEAQTNQPQVKTSGDVTYFARDKSKIEAPTSYAEINHFTALPYSTRISGFLDLYGDDKGYFGKTIVEKSLTDRLSFRSHVMHINEPFSQAGFGASYTLPTPKGTFAKLSYLPFFVDSKGNQVDNKQIVGYFVSADLPWNMNAFSFGEINVDGTKGPQWGYGEVEVAKKFGKLSVGANLQLNAKGAGEMTPEFVPGIAVRARF